jgi:hypothetical protein
MVLTISLFLNSIENKSDYSFEVTALIVVKLF